MASPVAAFRISTCLQCYTRTVSTTKNLSSWKCKNSMQVSEDIYWLLTGLVDGAHQASRNRHSMKLCNRNLRRRRRCVARIGRKVTVTWVGLVKGDSFGPSCKWLTNAYIDIPDNSVLKGVSCQVFQARGNVCFDAHINPHYQSWLLCC